MRPTLDSRYSFAGQFLSAAARMSRAAKAIEDRPAEAVDGDLRSEHLGYTSSAIMQSVAAIEADSWEVLNYGPGHHLGSSERNSNDAAFIAPLAETLESLDAIKRYTAVLHLLGRSAVDLGAQPWQDTQLLIRLRNEITHYKSRSGGEMDRAKLFSALKSQRFSRPPFWPERGMNFFPLHCLSAERAAWAVNTAHAVISDVYERFDVRSPLAGYPDGWFSCAA
jgi:hypothetical protein